MKSEYKNCNLEAVEYDEGCFELAVTDDKLGVELFSSTIENDNLCEEDLIEKLKIFVDSYKLSPEEYLEYGISKN